MDRGRWATRERATNYIVLTFVVLLAAVLTAGQILRTNMLSQARVTLDDYIDGDAPRPFASRDLLPTVMRGLNALTPNAAEHGLDRAGERIAEHSWTGFPIVSGTFAEYPRDIVWLALLQWVSLIGYALVGRRLYATLRGDSAWSRWIVGPALLLAVAPVVAKQLGHIYDFTLLFFVIALLYAMATERHRAYLLLFAVSCFNKETTILMTIAYAAIFFRRMAMPRLLRMLAAQVGIFLVVFIVERVRFEDNAGTGVEKHLGEQWPYFRDHLRSLPTLLLFCTGLVVLVFLFAFRWTDKPQLLRRAAIVIAPELVFVAYGAAPGEVRNLYEILPIVSLIVLCTLETLVGELRQRERRDTLKRNVGGQSIRRL